MRSNNHVKFVSYTGNYPNLCRGISLWKLAGTSGAAPRAALSLPLRAVGISLLKNTARIVEQKWNKR